MGYAGITRNFNMAKRVYLYSSLIWAVPAIIVQVLCTLFYPTPLASGEIGFIDVLDISLIIFSFYSIWVSYTGLKFLYPEAKISKLRLWFLILPTLVCIL